MFATVEILWFLKDVLNKMQGFEAAETPEMIAKTIEKERTKKVCPKTWKTTKNGFRGTPQKRLKSYKKTFQKMMQVGKAQKCKKVSKPENVSGGFRTREGVGEG